MRAGILALGLAACSFKLEVPGETSAELDAAPMPVDPDANAQPQRFHLRVEAMIDGESHLVIKGTTVHWKHFIYAAPGRWDADTAAPWTKLPIKLNGVDWYPNWPDSPDPENRSCDGCESDTTQLPIGVPRAPAMTTWTEVQTRRAQGIVQYPSAANDYELIVLISDYGVGSAAEYIVDIDVVPE